MTEQMNNSNREETLEEELERRVFESIGAASTCWESLEGTGVFQDGRAKDIGEELVTWIKSRFPIGEPMLGYATNAQLINELHARANVSRIIGEDWPNYSTVGDRG